MTSLLNKDIDEYVLSTVTNRCWSETMMTHFICRMQNLSWNFEPSNMKILFQCSKLLKVLEKKKKSIIVKYILPSILSFKMSAGL